MNLRELIGLLESSQSSAITITLTPAQRSAVEIYIVDPAHEEEPWYEKVSLRGNKLTLDLSYQEAVDLIIDAANSADAGDGHTPDRKARTALENLIPKLRVATGQAVSKPKKATPSKLKTLRSWILQAVNKPGVNKDILLNPEDYKTWAAEDGKDPESPFITLSTSNGSLKIYPEDHVRSNEFKLR